MSVLIKGMTMPKTCFDCPFMYHRTLCAANTKLVFDDPNYSELKGRYDGCPLEERNYWEETAHSFERTINKLQKAIRVERRGKWIPRIATGNIALIECSECEFHYPELLGAFSFYYCPHCGAKMERSEE